MTRRDKVELFDQIRREYEFGIGTIAGVARKLGIHRRTVRQAIACAIPPARKHPTRSRTIERWSRYELIVLDEVGYVPFAQVGAELLFQFISERAERATLIITTNLPFSEWTQVLPNARLCKALLDRVTDRAHIIETGTESYRFRRTMESRKRRGKKSADA